MEKGRNEFWVGLGEFPRVLTFLPKSMRYCLPAGLLAEAGAPGSLAAGGEGGLAEGLSVWDLSSPSALSGLSVRGWDLLPGAGLQLGPEPVRNHSGARREGGFVSSEDTSKAEKLHTRPL